MESSAGRDVAVEPAEGGTAEKELLVKTSAASVSSDAANNEVPCASSTMARQPPEPNTQEIDLLRSNEIEDLKAPSQHDEGSTSTSDELVSTSLRDEDETPVGSMGEQIPRHVQGTIGVDVHDVKSHIVETRESDIEMAVKMVKAVEEDAEAVAGSLAALFSSLQSALSEVTGSSIEHMRCHSEAAGLLQDTSIDAATKGNRFINACLRLNEEMKSMGSLAAQLKTLRQVVDQFDYHASRSLPRL